MSEDVFSHVAAHLHVKHTKQLEIMWAIPRPVVWFVWSYYFLSLIIFDPHIGILL